MGLARLGLRLVVGGLLAGHGLQKLRGSFGGSGLEGTAKMMHAIGMHPARQQAIAAGMSETLGGALTAAGLLSPLGPAMLTGTMAVAIDKVHKKNGVWASKGGFEYNVVIIAAAFLLASEGPGPYSIDALLGRERRGLRWGLLQLVLALATAAGAIAAGRRLAPVEGAPSEPEPTSAAQAGAEEAASSDSP